MSEFRERRLRQNMKIILTILFLFVSTLSQGNNPDHWAYMDNEISFQTADSLYSAGEYDLALSSFNQISEDKIFERDPSVRFRLAYTYFKTGNYDSSAHLFSELAKKQNYLSEYSDYFYIKSLWNLNSKQAVDFTKNYIEQYKKHALSDSLIIQLADYLFEQKDFNGARKYYLIAKKQNISPDITIYSRIKAAHCLYKTDRKKSAFDEYYQIIRRYSANEQVLTLTENLKQNEEKFFKSNFFSCADVFYNNGDFSALRLMLEKYAKSEKDPVNLEKARYYLIKIYFAENRSKTALYGFQNLLKDLKNKSLEPHIRLYIARSYYQMGYRRNAITAYMDYAKRYPRRRIAPEAVWKSAWIYEELGEIENALDLYRDLRKHWKNNEYGKEAYFREGFALFRLGRYTEADDVFSNIRFNNWPDIHVNRATYWSSLCRDIEGDSVTARRLRLDIAKNLWDDYYTMKSYLIHKAYIDTSWNIAEEFKTASSSMSYYGNGIAKLLENFDNAFLVRDLLGESYGFIALSDIKLSAKSWEEWMALAEIYKKFGAFNKAFKIYDLINYKFFGDLSFSEKPAILKERFPFYYDDLVEKYSKRYYLEPELIYAIIKQESVFDPAAHSWANAYGLMQLVPLTAGDMAFLARLNLYSNDLLLSPDVNIHLGSLYIKQLNRQFTGVNEKILAAYNAGPHRVKRWSKIPGSEQIDVFIENIEYSETRDYVRKVMKNYWAYKLLNNNFNLDMDSIKLSSADDENPLLSVN